MKFSLIFIIISLLFSGPFLAAQPDLEEIPLNQVQASIGDSLVVRALVDEANSTLYRDPNRSILLIDSALTLIPKDNLVSLQARAWSVKGIALSMIGNTAEGVKLFHRSRKVYELLGDEAALAKCVSNLGNVHRLNGRTDSTCYYLIESLHHSVMLKDTVMLINNYSNISGFFLEYDDLDRARYYLDECMKLEGSSGLYEQFAVPYQLKGYLELDGGRYAEAELSFTEADKRAEINGDDRLRASLIRDLAAVKSYTGKTDEARASFLEALEKERKVDVKHHIAGILNDFALFEARSANLPKADSLFNESLKIYEELGAEMDKADVLLGMARIDFEQKKFDNALTNATRALEIAEEQEAVIRQVDCLELLTSIYRELGETESVQKYDELLAEKLLLVQEDWDMLEGVIATMERKAVKEDLTAEKKKEEVVSNNRTWTLVFGVLIVLGLYFMVRRSKKEEG